MANNRQRNTGSITSHPYGYLARYVAPNGKRIGKVFKTHKDAGKWLRDELSDVDRGRWVEVSRTALAEWINEFILTYRPHVSNATRESYRRTIDRLTLFAPTLMSLPIQNITERHVQKALNDIRQARHSRTVIITRTLLNMALTKAHHLGLIKTNPVAGTSVQKSESSFGGKALSAAEQEKLLDYCHNHKSAVSDLLYTIYRTGCRTGEARALRSADVTPTGIHIRHALDRDGNLKGVKSNQARFVPIVDNVLLSRLIERSRTYNGFIFLSRNATTLDHNNISRRVRTLLEGHSPHDLRHTYITEAIRRGANLKALSEITGDQVNTLLNSYTHINHDDLTELANMML